MNILKTPIITSELFTVLPTMTSEHTKCIVTLITRKDLQKRYGTCFYSKYDKRSFLCHIMGFQRAQTTEQTIAYLLHRLIQSGNTDIFKDIVEGMFPDVVSVKCALEALQIPMYDYYFGNILHTIVKFLEKDEALEMYMYCREKGIIPIRDGYGCYPLQKTSSYDENVCVCACEMDTEGHCKYEGLHPRHKEFLTIDKTETDEIKDFITNTISEKVDGGTFFEILPIELIDSTESA